MRRITVNCLGWAAFSIGLMASSKQVCVALPTPALTEADMLKSADLVVEGRIVGVVLTKRWVGDKVAVDVGYEQGDFRSWVVVSKVLKGPSAVNDTVEVFTHAYKEGLWSDNGRRFVYEATEEAIIPGNRVRFYLKWDPTLRRYSRVHFNSGFVLIERSKGQYPTQVGQPAFGDAGAGGK